MSEHPEQLSIWTINRAGKSVSVSSRDEIDDQSSLARQISRRDRWIFKRLMDSDEQRTEVADQ
ncbi:MAG TPA: hypothetical protein VJB60_03040 [Candidatus Peribacterales bacterium]|nr:hypothetical protein [Candidatus Peribacterales bacterium]